jgi:hypothetical protein
MAKIKEGFNGKELEIKINGKELWLIQNGLPLVDGNEKYKETLSYVTINELIELRNEINEAIKELAGLQSN